MMSSIAETTLQHHESSLTRLLLGRPERLLLLAGLALRLAFAMLPLQLLLGLLEDDAWMVTAIARHWALGHGTTADGVNLTNGFHPLYPLTLGALPYLIRPHDLDFGFRANLVICALLNSLTLLPAYGLLRAVARRPLALAGLAILALNPLLVRVSVNAMETSLALLLLLLLWWYALVRPPARPGQAALMGLLAALAALARLDSLLAAALLGLALLWRELRARRWPVLSLSYGLLTGLLLLPYFVRNLLVFGALMPSSGRALAYLHSYRQSFAFSSGLQLVAYQPAIDLFWAPTLVLLAGVLGLGALALMLPRPRQRQLLPLLLYALLLTFYYSYMQQNGLPRYYTGVAVVLVLLLCGWLDAYLGRLRQLGQLAALLAAGLVLLNSLLFVGYLRQLQRAPYLAQPAMYQAARWVAANLPPDARLGAQNSGIYQYYSQHVVINFDGKLNHEIIPILEQRKLDSYLRSKGVDYIIDLPEVAGYLEFYSSSLSEARPHYEISGLQKLAIYARMIAAKLRLGPPVVLDQRVPTRVVQPFTSTATIVKQFPLPNAPQRAVTLYQLQDNFGKRP